MGENDQVISDDFEEFVRESGERKLTFSPTMRVRDSKDLTSLALSAVDTFGSLEPSREAVLASSWAPLPVEEAKETASLTGDEVSAAAWGGSSGSRSSNAPASGWGKPSTSDSSTARAWGVSSERSASTETAPATPAANMTTAASAAEQVPGASSRERGEQHEYSQDSSDGEAREAETSFARTTDEEADRGKELAPLVKDEVDDEIAALLKDAPVSPSSAESRPDDEAWIARMLANAELGKDDSAPAESIAAQDRYDPDGGADVDNDGSGTVTPSTNRSSPSPEPEMQVPA